MLDATGFTFRTALSAMKYVGEATVEEISGESGTCLTIEWRSPLDERFPDGLLFSLSRAKLRRDVCVVKGIGAKTRDKLARSGLRRLEDLAYSSRRSWRAQARLLLDWIGRDQVGLLRATRRVKDIDLMFCFQPEKVAYLDIETTGLHADARVFAIAIGIAAPEERRFKITQLFARDYAEEFTIVKRAVELLAGTGCIVTFNGKAFDVPVLKGRAWYYLGESDSVFERHHVDLVHELRRVKGLKRRAPLAHYEGSILHEDRAFDIPSAMIPGLYAEFTASGGGPAFTRVLKSVIGPGKPLEVAGTPIGEALISAHPGLSDMFRVLHHNMVDVRSLHRLLGWALRESYSRARASGFPSDERSG
ncbi:MAG: ribonuclease H-like domain-containing protein [Candidatus Lokiarchaeota archaeon]|nr:ribonuclease H-like domain-containing protein [Candidatus Lokiarchaeota archaeon]